MDMTGLPRDGFMANDVVLTYSDGTEIPLRQEGNELCLSIDPYVVFDSPLFLRCGSKAASALKLTLRNNAFVHLIDDTSGASSSLSVEIGEGASLQYTRLFLGRADAKEASFHAFIHAGGSLVCRTAVASSSFTSSCFVSLHGEGASAAFYGLSLLPPSKTSHQTLFVDHKAPNTSSSQLIKGLAADGACGLVESNVRICKEAKGSFSRQYSHFLTFGTTAKTVHKPKFEILTDDVSASHGATTGVLDDEALFYLRARGLCVSEARRYLVKGFCEEVVRDLPQEMVPILCQRMDEIAE
jgi:Fe-S cluster assembly protein SufD